MARSYAFNSSCPAVTPLASLTSDSGTSSGSSGTSRRCSSRMQASILAFQRSNRSGQFSK